MKKYSKNNQKKRSVVKFLIVVFAIFLILSITLLLYVLLNKNIVYEKINTESKFVSDDIAKNSTPVIIDNVLIGGVYDKKWVSTERFYLNSTNKANIEIDVYNKVGKKGTYELNSIVQGNTTTVYSATTNTNLVDEYFAVAKKEDFNLMKLKAIKRQNVTENEIKYVKNALGIYRLFNTTVKITEVYDVSLTQGNNGMLIFATNEVGKSMGVYSTVVYVDNNYKEHLIKYNFTRNVEDASDWPIYSFKFSGDLNLDGVNELIIQEIKEFEVKYDVIEYKDNKFSEVLSTIIK